MFSTEIKVNGRFIKGKIVKQIGFTPRLVGSISLTNNTWCTQELRSIADEFNLVADELDKQSKDKDEHIENCKYCAGESSTDREPLMKAQLSDYSVFINSVNYLEDSIVGGSAPHSLYGVKINYCPVCGKGLKSL
ncbi:hypothetical protein [Paenibacillus xylanexedens]|uniref:hypothetical protein n=1 Tax=Paenibacillus xylanexedens TaxID=528191 RepID=UPI000F547C12|nr:hypothetical protein [Paenibacillus xylanexedens]